MGIVAIRQRLRLTPDLRVEVVPVTLDELRPHLWSPPEPDGVRVRDYGQHADIYYRNWREFRNIHRASYMGRPIASLRDADPRHHREHAESIQGSVPFVSGYWSGTIDSLRLPAHNHRIGIAPSIVRAADDYEEETS